MQVKALFFRSDAMPFSSHSASVPMVRMLPTIQKRYLTSGPPRLPLMAEFATFGALAKLHGARLRPNLTGEIFQHHRLMMPPGLLQSLRAKITAPTESVTCLAASHVWSAQINGRRVRVIDPQRQAKPEFLDAMQRQFGKDHVGLCTRLWPEEIHDE